MIRLGGDLDYDAATALAATIHVDLNYDEAIDAWRQHNGDTVLIGIEPEPGDEELGGVQRHRGALVTEREAR